MSHFRIANHKYIHYGFVVEKLLHGCLKQRCLLLDAGCGKGGSMRLVPKNVGFVGVDILRANLVAAKFLRKNLSYVVADLTWLPFIEGAFGGALSVNVVEHVDDKTAVIGELARVTHEGGFFIGCSTNLLNPVLWLDVKLPMLLKPLVMKFAPSHHYYDRHSRFSPSSLTSTLNATGYQMDYLALLGCVLFNKEKQPWFAYLWILFDKLTRKKPLLYLKEVMVWKATRV